MKIQARDEKMEILELEKSATKFHIDMHQSQYSISNMLDYITYNGELQLKDPTSVHKLIANLIILPQKLEEEFVPKSRLDYSKLKAEGVRRIIEIMERFVDEQFIDIRWEFFDEEEKRDVLKQTLIDWSIFYIVSALEIKRRLNFSNVIGKKAIN